MSTFDYVLKLTDYNGSTVTLTSAPYDIKDWQVRTGSDDEPTVTETCEVRLTDGSVANNLDESRTLQQLLQQAKDAQKNRSFAKVYAVWQEATGGTVWRSEIKDGRAEWESEALQLPQWYGDTQFARVHWERSNWWDGPEAQLALSNLHDTDNTAGLTVYNHNTAGTSNYADIAGTAVLGDLPGATRLEITNTYDVAAKLLAIYIGQNIFTPSAFDHIIEGEDATLYGGSVIAGAGYSGGSFVRRTHSYSTEAILLGWEISAAQAEAAAGRLHRITFRSPTMMTTDVFRFRLKFSYLGVPIWQSDLVQPSSGYAYSIRNLFTVKLPPWLAGLSNQDGLTMDLYGMKSAAGSDNVDIDFIQLTPTDGYREIQAAWSVPYGDRIVDDGINNYLYVDDGAGADKASVLTDYGAPIHVWPGRDQRLYFLQHSSSPGTAEIARTISVKLYYRPRRRSL